jgi:hypothetical protein
MAWRLAVVLAVAGCSPAPPVARHTVEEYRADAALRASTLDTCANDPGTLREHPDCLNAQRAAALEGRGSLRSSGPVGLEVPRPDPPKE